MSLGNLGRYRLERELGRGAMGRVWLAHDPELDRHVALKTVQVFADLPDDERRRAREAFLQEARAAARLNHSGIVTIYDVGTHEGVPYIAMEFIEGDTLAAHGRGGEPLSPVEAVTLIAAVAEALGYAHEQGVVHGDIKPANLARIAPGEIKIVDFGLARMIGARAGEGVRGTPNYMSPEQIRGDVLDGRSDLFSLAAVLYELLTGCKPFPGDSVSSILYRVVHEPPPSFETMTGDPPQVLEAFLETALAKDPDDRCKDGRTFAHELRSAWGGQNEGISVVAEATDDLLGLHEDATEALPAALVPPRKPRRGRAGRLLFGLLIVAGLVAAGWWQRDRLRPLLFPEPQAVLFEARIETDPADLTVTLDGEPLLDRLVRFTEEGPFGTLVARVDCREATHTLSLADAGGTIVLVPESIRIQITIDPGVEGAVARLNGETLPLPASPELDLCQLQKIEIEAPEHQPLTVEIQPASTPLQARNQLAAISLVPIARGRLILPASIRPPARASIGGKRLTLGGEGKDLPPGKYRIHWTLPSLWLDSVQVVTIKSGQTVRLKPDLPEITKLTVQAFPANAVAWLRRPGGRWKELDDIPLTVDLAVGEYEVKVVSKASGQERSQKIRLVPGKNPPVRITFARSGS